MAKKNKCCQGKDPKRLNKVGGQAVLEGVMMKAGERTVTTCRKEDGSIVVYDNNFISVRTKCKLLNIPILRGIINFIEMLMLSFKTLGYSADAMGLDEGEKKEEGKTGITTTIVMSVSMILGVALSLGLFILLPGLISDLAEYLFMLWGGIELGATWRAVIEGCAKVMIFILYLYLVSLMPDIKRTFMYHGAEHKSIACFESGEELTPQNAKKFTRLHPRCGTSFMFVMILLGIVVGIIINNVFPELGRLALTAIRLAILPLVVGIGYEFIMFAGKHDNPITRALSAPGLWMQKITTKEPTEDMLEIAIISIKCALRDEFPEFREFYDERSWEAKPAEGEESEAPNDSDDGSLVSTEGNEENEAIEGN